MSWDGLAEIFNPGHRHWREELERERLEAQIPSSEAPPNAVDLDRGVVRISLPGQARPHAADPPSEPDADESLRPAGEAASQLRGPQDVRYASNDHASPQDARYASATEPARPHLSSADPANARATPQDGPAYHWPPRPTTPSPPVSHAPEPAPRPPVGGTGRAATGSAPQAP